MSKLFLAAGVAALAIAAPVAAEKGQGGGKGNKGHSAKAERGGGKGSSAKMERRGGGQRFAARADRGDAKADRKMFKAERKMFKAERQAFKTDRKEFRAERKELNRDRDFARVRDFDDDRFDRRDARRSLARWDDDADCPPGLRWKNAYCMPPGQFKKLGENGLLPVAYRDRRLPLGLRDLYRDDDDYMYRLGDGYVYRVDRRTSLVAALLPLLGGGLSTGQLFPSAYSNYMVPTQYRAFYPDNSDD